MARKARQGSLLPDATGTSQSPFLEPDDIGKVGKKATMEISGARVSSASKFGPSVIVHVKIGKREYDWTQRINTPNYARLLDMFGNNPAEWKGTVKVEVQKSAKWKANYIAVLD